MGGKSARDNNPKLLLKLLQICFERFRSVVSAHGVLLSHLQRSKRVYNRSGEGEGLERRGGEGRGGKGRERVREIEQGRCGSKGGGGEVSALDREAFALGRACSHDKSAPEKPTGQPFGCIRYFLANCDIVE